MFDTTISIVLKGHAERRGVNDGVPLGERKINDTVWNGD